MKSDTDEVLKEIQAAEEEVLQSQLAKARTAGNALGDDPAFAKQVADLQREIARLDRRLWAARGTKVALREQGDQEAGTNADGLRNEPSCAYRS